ncbi:GNAT family N-acetyltransferase [Streptomyces sp. HU2014]|uniref:N-acetyltransferase GCN5 n=1 Tax=Streptomyces albireticuli TaxID=1940 RepID=A0A1Z2L1V9_9ACTN|nr:MULTISPECIES: GNAT family N-acetyltransferase [Streptomyces]ARZ68287.1 N-acetyltransferase GCN5 [Streptomyces albireticuli]UQI48245.1 GNAT family N-acetyltransferase [Streptomyces sp. HU2014]
MVEIGKLTPADREAWEALFRAYIDFYERDEPQAMYDTSWSEFQADTRMHAFGAKVDGKLVGITHFFVHANTSGPDVCYLQDLFTGPEARRKGVGEALIAAVVDWAKQRGCSRVYWMTHETNATARSLYEKVAVNKGFLRYQIELPR